MVTGGSSGVILVTGGSGLIGLRLVTALLNDRQRVRATCASDAGAQRLETLAYSSRLSVERWRLGEGSIRPLLEGVSCVVHLAARRYALPGQSGDGHREMPDADIEATLLLARTALEQNGSRFILGSSTARYGRIWGVADENSAPVLRSRYGDQRAALEARLEAMFTAAPDRLTIARITETTAPGKRSREELRALLRAGRFRLIGTGEAMHHVSRVDDVVDGLRRCIASDTCGGRTFNLGSVPVTFDAFVSAEACAVGGRYRRTPALQMPSVLLLRTFRRFARLRNRFPGLYQTLDYQVRPRAFDTSLSRRLLGDYGGEAAALRETA